MNLKQRCTAAAAAGALLFLPLAASAQTAGSYADAPLVLHLATTFSGEPYLANGTTLGPFQGELDLNVGADDIVTGYYRPDPSRNFVVVTGGKLGSTLWLVVHGAGNMQIRGELSDGAFNGTATTNGGYYTVTGTPVEDGVRRGTTSDIYSAGSR